MSAADHWDKIYASTPTESLGWYEPYPSPSIDMILRCGLPRDAPILDVGAGATNLIECLIVNGFTNVAALDCSSEALKRLKGNLTDDQSRYVRLIHADVCGEDWPKDLGPISLWHDRALLHFLIEPSDRTLYVQRLRTIVGTDGIVLIGAFSLDGADRCSGLPVHRYSPEALSELLGEEFELLESLDHLYTMPSGDTRPYVYARFSRAT